MNESFNAVWMPLSVADLQSRIDEQNKLIDVLREQMRDQHEKLRDRFAMAALTGLLAAGETTDPPKAAEYAYQYADETMKRRESVP